MKNLIIIYVSFFLFSCSITKKPLISESNGGTYLVEKIDKNNSWFIIYAKKADTLYKIISFSENNLNLNCKKIYVGGRYDFNLISKNDNIPTVNGIKLIPMNYLDVKGNVIERNGVKCFVIDKKTTICVEPKLGIHDIFYTYDLKGLCYLK